VFAQISLQGNAFHASTSSMTSRTASGERVFSAGSRSTRKSFNASSRFALASGKCLSLRDRGGDFFHENVYSPCVMLFGKAGESRFHVLAKPTGSTCIQGIRNRLSLTGPWTLMTTAISPSAAFYHWLVRIDDMMKIALEEISRRQARKGRREDKISSQSWRALRAWREEYPVIHLEIRKLSILSAQWGQKKDSRPKRP
jgi:hypothetical protein